MMTTEEFNDIPAGSKLFPGTKLEILNRAGAGPETAFMEHDLAFTHESRVEGYMPLELVLLSAYAQAAQGKGKERHAAGDPFMEQPIISIGRMLKSCDGEIYQVMKKTREGLFLHRQGETARGVKEILGAINYLAATALLMVDEDRKREVDDFNDPSFDPISDAVAAAQITTAELDTIMGLRRGECSVVTAGSIVPLPASAISPPEPSYAEFEVECPDPGVVPTPEQFLYALLKYGPGNLAFGIADHLGAHDAMSRLEFFRLMANEASQLAGCKLRKSDVTETYNISRRAVREWRTWIFGDDE